MWTVLMAVVVASPRPAARPLVRAGTETSAALAQPVARTAPEVVRRVEAAQGGTSVIGRVMNGIELNGPVVLKPDFHAGPGAAIALKF
jgi:hypothetical protein